MEDTILYQHKKHTITESQMNEYIATKMSELQTIIQIGETVDIYLPELIKLIKHHRDDIKYKSTKLQKITMDRYSEALKQLLDNNNLSHLINDDNIAESMKEEEIQMGAKMLLLLQRASKYCTCCDCLCTNFVMTCNSSLVFLNEITKLCQVSGKEVLFVHYKQEEKDGEYLNYYKQIYDQNI